jgi:4-hydroxy-2-oxoheptanedioate aldolase
MNRIREALAAGRPTFGAWCCLPGSLSAEFMGGAGFDWVIVDAQHGAVTVADLVPVVQALQLGGTPAVVRVPWTDPPTIMRVLDFGAAGVLVPMVNSAEDAAAAARAVRYPPDGIRSYGQTRPRYASTADANADVVLLVMIETAEALANLEAIAATPGVDGLFVGPVDLGLSLGLPLDFTGTAPPVVEATERVVTAAAAAGKFAGSVSSGAEQAADLVRRGVSFVTLGADVGYLRAGIARDASAAESLRGR